MTDETAHNGAPSTDPEPLVFQCSGYKLFGCRLLMETATEYVVLQEREEPTGVAPMNATEYEVFGLAKASYSIVESIFPITDDDDAG